MNILLTGGAGYIGTHILVELIETGHTAIVVDNFSNSSREALKRVEYITGQYIPFYDADIRDKKTLERIFSKHSFDCCIHLAGLKAVGESVRHPREYYDNNVAGMLCLLDVMQRYGCKNIIFSSSATVYGEPEFVPITEECHKGQCTNPYGWTKWFQEEILSDLYVADKTNGCEKTWNVILLRYFNPTGAHKSGLIGENPKGIPNNLMSYITQVAIGRREMLHVFGNDYDTPDGTGIRDYIHVVDLAKGHVKALDTIMCNCGVEVFNLGTGKGYSVFEIINTFERVNEIKIPYVIDARRPGDISVCYSSPEKANKELNWKAEYGIEDMCRDSWNWQKNNPNGF